MDDDMVELYKKNPDHYKTGLTRIGCSVQQAKNYSEYFQDLRSYYYTYIINEVKNQKKPINIVDLGCGTGDDLFSLDKFLNNVQLYGFELSNSTVQLNNSRLEKVKMRNNIIFTNNYSDIPNKNDLVINFCVLEHVNSPIEFIKECCDLLTKEGVIIMTFPNHYYWWFWDIINLTFQKIRRNSVKTHSVSQKKFYDAVLLNNLKIIHHETFGFRPPQILFKYFCENNSKHIRRKSNFQSISHVYQRIGLQKFLYLHLFILKNKESPIATQMIDSNNYKSKLSIFRFTLISMKYFLFYQIIVIHQLGQILFGRFKKDEKS